MGTEGWGSLEGKMMIPVWDMVGLRHPWIWVEISVTIGYVISKSFCNTVRRCGQIGTVEEMILCCVLYFNQSDLKSEIHSTLVGIHENNLNLPVFSLKKKRIRLPKCNLMTKNVLRKYVLDRPSYAICFLQLSTSGVYSSMLGHKGKARIPEWCEM